MKRTEKLVLTGVGVGVGIIVLVVVIASLTAAPPREPCFVGRQAVVCSLKLQTLARRSASNRGR